MLTYLVPVMCLSPADVQDGVLYARALTPVVKALAAAQQKVARHGS